MFGSKKNIFTLLFGINFFSLTLFSQPDPAWVLEPTLTYSNKLTSQWTFGSKISAFQFLTEMPENKKLSYLEPQFSLSYSITPTIRFGGGYEFRNSTPMDDRDDNEHRWVQQIVYTIFFGDDRLSQRLKTEQRYRASGYINRWRYLLSVDFPLSGKKLTPGENYIVFTNEFLGSFTEIWDSGENRLSAILGWYFSSQLKAEIGLQWRRLNLFSDKTTSTQFLLTTGWFFSH